MRANILTSAFLITGLLLFVGCDNSAVAPIDGGYGSGTEITNPNENENDDNGFPKEVSFTELSLENTSCRWEDRFFLNLGFVADSVVLLTVNSNKELRQLLDCADGDYPEIDFSEHTLLLASGVTPNGICEITKNLLQLSENEYVLNIEIVLNATRVIQDWHIALVTHKLKAHYDNVQVNVNIIKD